eukprot:GHVT01100395.1.p2 GENE.GHVT01100395.1~~GHVT01100395.1.p2  ORF type:complete len:194 (-),score=31.55 GHVT01100395.1:2107-2688(-)
MEVLHVPSCTSRCCLTMLMVVDLVALMAIRSSPHHLSSSGFESSVAVKTHQWRQVKFTLRLLGRERQVASPGAESIMTSIKDQLQDVAVATSPRTQPEGALTLTLEPHGSHKQPTPKQKKETAEDRARPSNSLNTATKPIPALEPEILPSHQEHSERIERQDGEACGHEDEHDCREEEKGDKPEEETEEGEEK